MAFCYRGKIDDDSQAIVPAVVAPQEWWSKKSEDKDFTPQSVNALVDTGANITCISQKIAEKLQLTIVDETPFTSVDQVSIKNLYLVDIRLMHSSEPKDYHTLYNVLVAEIYGDIDHMLIGMDIINTGQLEIGGGKFSLRL